MTKVLVTGAAGFIGRHLVERLLADRHSVVGVVRNQTRARKLLGDSAVEWIEADVRDETAMRQAMQGVSAVYHLAGVVLATRRRPFEQNVEGARSVAAACAAAGSPALIYVSSTAAGGPALGERPRRESDRAKPVSNYGRSKQRAEACLSEFAGEVPITIVRPPSVFGPREPYLLSFFAWALRGWAAIPGLHPARYSLVHVEDLVDGMITANRRGRRLQPATESPSDFAGCYHLAHRETPTLAEVANLAAKQANRSGVRTIPIPHTLCRAMGWGAELLQLLSPQPLLLNRDKVREITAGSWTCDTDRAAQELDFQPPEFSSRLAQTIQWYQDQGLLR